MADHVGESPANKSVNQALLAFAEFQETYPDTVKLLLQAQPSLQLLVDKATAVKAQDTSPPEKGFVEKLGTDVPSYLRS